MVEKNLLSFSKKAKYLLFAAIFTLISSKSSFAASHSLSLSCPASTPASQTISCTLSGYSSDSISSVSAQLSLNNFEYSSFVPSSPWSGSLTNGSLSASAQSSQSGNFTIGTITLIASSSSNTTGSSSLKNVFFSNGSYTRFSVSDTDASISITPAESTPSSPVSPEEQPEETEEEVGEDKTALKSLKIAGYDLDFSKDQYTYTLELKETDSSLDIVAKPFDETATVTISNNNDLKDGSIVKITVETPESKSVYRIKMVIAAPVAPEPPKEEPSSTFDPTILIIIIIIVLVLTAGILAFFIFKKKKPKDHPIIIDAPKNPLPRQSSFTKQEVQLSPLKSPEGSAYKNSEKPLEKTPITPIEKAPAFPPAPNPFLTQKPPVLPPEKPLTAQPQTSAQPPQPTQIKPQPLPSQPPTPAPRRPISLDDIPFNQEKPETDNQEPTTPFIFES